MSDSGPILIAALLSFAVGGGVAWFLATSLATRKVEERHRQSRLRSAAELKKLRQDLVLDREKHRRAEEVSAGVIRSREHENAKARAELVEAGKKLEEVRGLYLKAQGDVSRFRKELAEQQFANDAAKRRLGELEWAVAPKKRKTKDATGVEIEIDVLSAIDGDETIFVTAATRAERTEAVTSPSRSTDRFDDTRPGSDLSAPPSADDTHPVAPAEEDAPAEAAGATVTASSVPEPRAAEATDAGDDTVFAGGRSAAADPVEPVSATAEAAPRLETPPPPEETPAPLPDDASKAEADAKADAPSKPAATEDAPAESDLAAATPASTTHEIESIRGIGPAVAKALRAAGLGTVEALAGAAPETIRAALSKRTRDQAGQFRAEARALLERPAGEATGARKGGRRNKGRR